MRASTFDDHLLRGKTQTCRMNFQGQLLLPYPRQFKGRSMRLYHVCQPRESLQPVQAPPQAPPRSPHRGLIQILKRYVHVLADKRSLCSSGISCVILKLNIWPFSFFLSYCSVCCWFLWFACCSSSSIKIAFGTEIPCFLHIFSHRCVTLLMLIVARLSLFNDLKRKPYGLP